jgi:hypothetical protein
MRVLSSLRAKRSNLFAQGDWPQSWAYAFGMRRADALLAMTISLELYVAKNQDVSAGTTKKELSARAVPAESSCLG